jgi:hypothetical protein
MPQIIAWQCEDTKEVFIVEADYKKHLRKIAAQKREIAKAQNIKDTYFDWLNAERVKISHIDEIVPWLLKNQQYIMNAANVIPEIRGHFGHRDKFCQGDEFTKLELKQCSWSQHVSNSHECPRNGVTNWCARDKTKPTGYPGWTGRINGSLKRAPQQMSDYPSSTLLNAAGIYTGCGGGGNNDWAYDVRLFDCEWPQLTQSLMFDKLVGKTTV